MFDRIEDFAAVGGAHQSREVEAAFVIREEFEEFSGVAAGVDDGKALGVWEEVIGEGFV